jgi:hypothetical protein
LAAGKWITATTWTRLLLRTVLVAQGTGGEEPFSFFFLSSRKCVGFLFIGSTENTHSDNVSTLLILFHFIYYLKTYIRICSVSFLTLRLLRWSIKNNDHSDFVKLGSHKFFQSSSTVKQLLDNYKKETW